MLSLVAMESSWAFKKMVPERKNNILTILLLIKQVFGLNEAQCLSYGLFQWTIATVKRSSDIFLRKSRLYLPFQVINFLPKQPYLRYASLFGQSMIPYLFFNSRGYTGHQPCIVYELKGRGPGKRRQFLPLFFGFQSNPFMHIYMSQRCIV